MFGRKKDTSESTGSVRADKTVHEPSAAPQQEQQSTDPKYTPPKGRPTPSRKEREAARRQPLVPEDRKAAKEAAREAAREQRQRENIAMQTGDEKYLPLRDKGPQRRYVRDYVDARWNVGDFLLPVILIIFILGIFISSFRGISTFFMWGFILLWLVDSWLMWRALKKKLVAKFTTPEPGLAMYTFNRVMMIRRMRLPKPQVKRGEYPR